MKLLQSLAQCVVLLVSVPFDIHLVSISFGRRAAAIAVTQCSASGDGNSSIENEKATATSFQ